MTKTKERAIVLVSALIVVSVLVYYQYAEKIVRAPQTSDTIMKPDTGKRMPVASGTKEVSAEVSYGVPGDKIDDLRFVVTLNQDGMIEEIKTLDAKTGEIPEKKKEFNEQVNVILKGKKLSELSAIDKVGTSSLTTDAFNEALPKLQAAM